MILGFLLRVSVPGIELMPLGLESLETRQGVSSHHGFYVVRGRPGVGGAGRGKAQRSALNCCGGPLWPEALKSVGPGERMNHWGF